MAQYENRWRGEGRDWRDDDREPNRHRDWGEAPRRTGVYDQDDSRQHESMYRTQAHRHQDDQGRDYRDAGYGGRVGNESGGYGRDSYYDDNRRDNSREMERVYDRSFGGGRDMSRGGYGAGYGGRSGSSGYGGYAGAGNAGTEGNYTSRDIGSADYRDRDYGVRPYGEGAQGVRGRGSLGYGGREYGERNLGDRTYGSGDYRNRDYGSRSYGSRDYGSQGGGYGGGYESSRDRGDWDRGDMSRRDFGGGYQRDDYRDRSWGEDRGGMYRSQESRGYGENRGRGEQRGFWEQAGDEIASWFGDDDAERRRHEDQMRASRHRGRGPRGYSRSDERVREDVSDRLTDDAYIDASDIEVSVSGGEVTLTGMVPDRNTKRRAEDVAESVSGVSHVQNNLRVRSQTAGQTGSNWGSSTGAGASAMATAGGISTSGTGSSSMRPDNSGYQGSDTTTAGTAGGLGVGTGSNTGSSAPSVTGTGAGTSGGPAAASAGTGSMAGSTTGVTGSTGTGRSSTTRS
ncbi:osmotically-inducible protein OsmY [Azospirillum lipoferum]|uniref:BON domain-containing protein n=1 Tax=Azospirillum lipoferum TaxID=193 RepID=A0A5A9GXR0_AZOLI|nr:MULTISPECIES: BON domain-containing protein [Azospirillum]KAA0598562.1 BON domain-containing protein [Azospirillum lipoferum]MCP1609427.1 osmotically-inducible protein OsmY [Azospirillum lipoferum]MDW5535264.1 BON domain-containing protein [Azospirillum sp. NL1]